jgi:conjugal transfer mating pair stabilization protein TraG
MVWEVHTFGGGEYLWDVFNGIAAITSGKSYLSIITISGLFGLTWAMLQSSFGGGYKASVPWIVSFMLFYNVMFLPKATVIINDPLNVNAPYEKVSNVPFALAMFAGLSSQIGKNITEQMEAAFSRPDYLPYHKHGMLFGSKLLSMSTNMKIQDEDFASSINSFMKQCVFYDLLLHRYSLDDLKKSPDIWSFLTKENLASQARSFAVIDKGEQSIVTCRIGATMLNERWGAQADKVASLFGWQLFPDKSNAEAKSLFLKYLPTSYAGLKNASRSASDIIKQNLLVNSIDRAATDFSNTGSNLYTTIRANVQTKAAFNASKRQAESWVPILRIVFEVLFYGAFPLVFLLFLLPIGPQVAKGYFTTFIWLQSWGPLYAILNRIMSGYASLKTSAMGEYGMSIVTQSGIAAVQQDVSEMSGYLAWSIPFIAAGLTKGVVAISGLSASMLAVPQNAANTAAAEAASGNISLGNMNLDNMSYGNVSANKINDSTFFDNERVQAVNHTGGMTTINSDGRAVYDQTGSVSRIPNMQLSTNDSLVESASQTANIFQTMGENLAKQASYSKAKSIDQLAQSMASHSVSENNGMRWTEHASSETREAYSRIEQEAGELARNNSIDKSTAFNMVMNGSISGSLGSGGAGGKGLGLGISAGFGGSAEAKSTEGHSNTERATKINTLQKDISTVMSAVSDRSLELTDSNGRSLNESFNQNFSEAQRLEEQSRTYFDTARSFSEQAQLMRSQGSSFSHDRMPEFIEYAKAQKDINGQPLGERVLSMIANDPGTSERLKESFVRDTHNSISNSFKHNVGSSDLRNQYTEVAANIKDDIGDYNNASARANFIGSNGKHIDNKDLMSGASIHINDNKAAIANAKVDKAGMENEVREKLSHDATATMWHSAKQNAAELTGFSETAKPKSNFNNQEGN